MTTLEQFVSPALTRALGWTLLHSLWQGALVAAVLAGALLLLRRQRAEVRYVASAGALGMVVALAGITFGLYFNSGAGRGVQLSPGTVKAELTLPSKQAETLAASVSAASREAVTLAAVAGGPTADLHQQGRSSATEAPLNAASTQSKTSNWLAVGLRYFDNNLPLLVVAWLLGLLAMSLRMLGGLLYVQRLRSYRVRPLPAVWQERLAALAARSGVRRPVALLESALVQVPLVVGHIRPVILLPLGTVAGLSPAYLEAILAHELAHVLRRDYLVNLLQTVAEVLFFYHPAVWFMANCVRTERENCCDDTATALVGGDPLRLARALTALAEWSQSAVVTTPPRLALAAMGKHGALLNRVRRLVTRRPAAPTLAEGIMAGALVLGGLGLLGGSVALAGPLAQPTTPGKPEAFDWQTGQAQTPAKPVGNTDTTKRTTTTTSSTTAASQEDSSDISDAVLLPGGRVQAKLSGVQVEFDTLANPEMMSRIRHQTKLDTALNGANAGLTNDELTPDDQPGQDHPGRKHRERRVIVNGRDMGPQPFPGQPGTVVITKDKKGRVTDLVVNGQRVDAATETGKGKLKIKDKKGKDDKDQQVQIIQVMPQGGDAQVFAFRNDGGNQRQFERNVERNVERQVERNFNRNYNYQFKFPELDKQLNRSFDVAPRYKLSPDGQLNRTYRLQSLDARPDPASLNAQREALKTAERALREANSVKSLSAEQRKRIGKDLENVRNQLKQLESASSSRRLQFNGAEGSRNTDEQFRKMEDEMRDREAEMRDRQQELQERRQELQKRMDESRQQFQDLEMDRANRDREHADRDRERADRDREHADRDQERADRRREQDDALVNELVKDGLVKDKDNFQLRLTATALTINGKEQPKKVFEKYLKLYESANPNRKMGPKGSMMITRNGNSSNSNFDQSEGPRPPRPPRPPKAPMAEPPLPPMAPMAPMAPPAPPRIDTESLRSELRKDGLIGSDDKDFQLQLNNSGLTVNGKKQSDELANKYRKLTGHEGGKKFNVTISSQE